MRCLSPISIKNDTPALEHKFHGKVRHVPCGRCAVCVDNKRKAWVFRLHQENKNSMLTYFITLTYTPNTLPINSKGHPTFSKRDIQLFFKRFRKEIEKQSYLLWGSDFISHIRYFLVSEYGSQFGRPHYHAIVFNLPFGVDIFKAVHSSWGKGRVHASLCKDEDIGYCANYLYGKSMEMPEDLTDETNKPFILTSRRPGIGSCYLTPETIKWHLNGLVTYGQIGDIKYSLPQFFKNKIFTEDKQKSQIFVKSYLRLLAEEIEQYQRDKEYDDNHVFDNDFKSMAMQRRDNYVRKFYNRVKGHFMQTLNDENRKIPYKCKSKV